MKYRLFALSIVTLFVATLTAVPVLAANTKLDDTGQVVQSYVTDKTYQTGTVMQVDEKNPAKVIPASKDKLDKAFGVVVNSSNLPLSITDTNAPGQAYVAASGQYDALVTTENGTIQSGDNLAVSSLSGTLMKAADDQNTIFAKALGGFDGQNRSGTITLKDSHGKEFKKVAVGTIPVAIGVMKNPGGKSTKTNLPSALQRIGQAVADKPVNGARIYISIIVMGLSVAIALALLYVGVRSALIAIGRNPLAKKSILKALLEVVLTSVIVLIIGLFTVYLILRL